MARAPRPGPLQACWDLFKRSLRPEEIRRKRNWMGEDHLGNRYYEDCNEVTNKKRRGFVQGHKTQWEDIPVEWFAWLELRRSRPPTQDEINTNLRIIEGKREGAARIAAARDMEKQQRLLQAAADNELPPSQPLNASESSDPIKFPRHSGEFEQSPGQIRGRENPEHRVT